MSAKPIHAMILAEVRPECRAEALEVLTEMVDLCRQEEGCLRFDLYCDKQHPCLLNTIEEWDSLESHAQHLASRLVESRILSLVGKFKGLPTIRILTPLNEMAEEA